MPSDLYIYLRGGRGDAFISGWDGLAPEEEGALGADGLPVEVGGVALGTEVSEPYRDIFMQGGQEFQVAKTIELPGDSTDNVRATKDFALPPGNAYYTTGVLQETSAYFTGNDLGAITAGFGAIKSEDADGESTLKTTVSDDLAHMPPRQFTKVVTWLVFTATTPAGIFKFRKADVIGWGSAARL